MNKLSKAITGWFVWTIGAIVYAHLTYNAAPPVVGEMTAIEFVYGSMMGAYFFGVPVLTGFWIFGAPK